MGVAVGAVGRLRFGFGWAAVRFLGGGALAVAKVGDERLFTKCTY